ncbi:MAG: NUDIX hydrolase [Opitutia bacterium Tous-C1TDCM]|nr:MAG: NUDIX hydrolase [Opitutae bacterium Tous-C1TDCM]
MSNGSKPPERWALLGEHVRHETPIFNVLGRRYRHPVRRTEREFVVLAASDWVNVVALTADRRIVLVRQFRYGLDDFSLEIPGGVMDPGEDPVTAGLRELQEETGYAGGRARLLGSVNPNPAIQTNRCHFVFVEGAVATGATEWDTDEEIEVVALPADDVYALARNGGIVHALVLNALMLFEPEWRARRGGTGV